MPPQLQSSGSYVRELRGFWSLRLRGLGYKVLSLRPSIRLCTPRTFGWKVWDSGISDVQVGGLLFQFQGPGERVLGVRVGALCFKVGQALRLAPRGPSLQAHGQVQVGIYRRYCRAVNILFKPRAPGSAAHAGDARHGAGHWGGSRV